MISKRFIVEQRAQVFERVYWPLRERQRDICDIGEGRGHAQFHAWSLVFRRTVSRGSLVVQERLMTVSVAGGIVPAAGRRMVELGIVLPVALPGRMPAGRSFDHLARHLAKTGSRWHDTFPDCAHRSADFPIGAIGERLRASMFTAALAVLQIPTRPSSGAPDSGRPFVVDDCSRGSTRGFTGRSTRRQAGAAIG
ncbi:MAG: hypothetical protein KDH17_16645 [Rhodocyclaceae bacterium]|nr:hypothetical protein [Rhodocyclaceae bacterium]